MIRHIIKFPDPILRKKCEEVKELTPEIKELINDMIETMQKNDGVGLAAPQVGVLKRIIVVETEKGPKVLINPKIIKKSKEMTKEEEGCLSFPELFLKIKRPKEVLVETFDKKNVQITAKNLLARVIQHEIDHLDGILFIDHVRVERRIWELLKFYLKSKK